MIFWKLFLFLTTYLWIFLQVFIKIKQVQVILTLNFTSRQYGPCFLCFFVFFFFFFPLFRSVNTKLFRASPCTYVWHFWWQTHLGKVALTIIRVFLFAQKIKIKIKTYILSGDQAEFSYLPPLDKNYRLFFPALLLPFDYVSAGLISLQSSCK